MVNILSVSVEIWSSLQYYNNFENQLRFRKDAANIWNSIFQGRV